MVHTVVCYGQKYTLEVFASFANNFCTVQTRRPKSLAGFKWGAHIPSNDIDLLRNIKGEHTRLSDRWCLTILATIFQASYWLLSRCDISLPCIGRKEARSAYIRWSWWMRDEQLFIYLRAQNWRESCPYDQITVGCFFVHPLIQNSCYLFGVGMLAGDKYITNR